MPSYDQNITNRAVYQTAWDAFSGTDMHVVFGNKELGDVSAITVTVTRDVVPRYTAGQTDARAFARGRRGIAGTMTFSLLNRDPLLRDLFADKYFKSLNSIWSATNGGTFGYHLFQPEGGGTATSAITAEGLRTGLSDIAIREALEIQELIGQHVRIRYIDQLPPIDVTISFVSDAGAVSVATLQGVVFLSEGVGWSIADVETEIATTFMARSFTPLTAVVSSRNLTRL